MYDIPYTHKLLPGGKLFTLLLVYTTKHNCCIRRISYQDHPKYWAGRVVAPNDCKGMNPDTWLIHIGMIVGSVAVVSLLSRKEKGKRDVKN